LHPPSTSPDTPRHSLLPPEPVVFGSPSGASRDLEAALALATHQCAALTADVEAMVRQVTADLAAAVADAEQRIQAASERAAELIARAQG
jgi:hypothetical protein